MLLHGGVIQEMDVGPCLVFRLLIRLLWQMNMLMASSVIYSIFSTSSAAGAKSHIVAA
jgi:hypothetical protein